MSVDEFCADEGVSLSTFYRWVSRLKDGIPNAVKEEGASLTLTAMTDLRIFVCTAPTKMNLGFDHLNVSERTLRQQAIGRKNWLFLGSEQAGPRAAVLFTILSGAKRHRIKPWAYLREILLRLHADDAHLDEMLPDRWAADLSEMILSYRLEGSRRKASRQRDRRRHRRARCRPK